MRTRLAILAFMLGLLFPLQAQKPVALKTLGQFRGKSPELFNLFSGYTPAREDTRDYVANAHNVSMRTDVFDQLKASNAPLIRIAIPGPDSLALDLYRAEVFSGGARIRTSNGQILQPNSQHHFYRGIIHGDPHSLAIVSVFQERVQIVFADRHGNRRIQKMNDGQYLFFKDEDLRIPKDMNCYTEDTPDTDDHDHNQSGSRVTGNCVEIYVECDYKSYQDNGSSVSNTEEWVAELWNEVITLYDNEDIPVAVSDVFVYTSSDPFANLNSTSAVLYAFADHMDTLTYNGHLAHLLSTRNLGGGIAFLDVLCANSNKVAFSANLSTNIVPVPTYSWTVEVVTHEMGHNMGSRHTHACAWNGNNTQIDDCGNVYAQNNGQTPEGNACFNSSNPILPTSGTIMSYCHLIGGIGIDFNNGFGTQPGNRIRSEYNNAPCNTGTCSPPLCTNLTTPAPGATNVDVNQDLFWASADGANGYKLTIGTTPTNGSILNNVDVGNVTTYNPPNALPFSTTIYVKIVPYNNLGDAVGCSNQTFTTEANVAPACTQLTYPLNGAQNIPADAVLTWKHSVGNQTGYKLSIGTSPGGTQILNNLNVGNVTSYDHPSSYPYGTTLYVKITPYWSGGDISNCASESFTTIVPLPGDFCNNAISLPCGASIEGSTSSALPESGVPNCGANIEAPGIWYTFVGDGTNAVISLCTEYTYDTQLNAYSGSCNSLTCVTGIDDFCYIGSQISFPTVAGTNYFVLVQGWGGETGDYTITRSCYSGPFYCLSSGRSPFLEWISNVTFANVSNASGSTSYTDNTDEPITVSRGGSYTLSLTPSFAQGTRNEYFKVWIDYNHDGDFSDSGEQVYAAGPVTSTVSTTIMIPVTATKNITRMRVAMRYNQTPSSSCGTFGDGEVEDYALNVRCNLVTSTSDSGNGSLRSVATCVDDNEPVLFASSLNGQTLTVTGAQIISDGQWKWMAGENTNITIQASAVNRILRVAAGTNMEIQNLTFIGGTATTATAIDNQGTLLLRNCNIHPAVGSTNTPLRNTGQLTMEGVCDITY